MAEDDGTDVALARRQRLYNDAIFSDVTVCFNGQSIHAHKAILSISSEFFHRAFSGGFKEGTSKEINLFGDDTGAVTGMLRHIYGLCAFENCTGRLFFAIELLTVADKYDVPDLRTKCQAIVEEALRTLRSTNPTKADWATEVVRDVYEAPACNEKLRRIAVEIFQDDLKAWTAREDFQKLLQDIPQVSIDLVHVVADRETAPMATPPPKRGYKPRF